MNNLLSKVKLFLETWWFVVVAVAAGVIMFASRGGDVKEFAKLRDKIDEFRKERDRNQGRIEEIQRDTDQLNREIEETTHARRESEKDLNPDPRPREELRDFIDRYNGHE